MIASRAYPPLLRVCLFLSSAAACAPQVAFADRMLLNKTDLVSEADLTRVEARLRAINSFAPIVRCCKSQVSADSVLNIGAFDLKRTLEMDAEFLSTDGEHTHDASVSSMSITAPGDCDLELVQVGASHTHTHTHTFHRRHQTPLPTAALHLPPYTFCR